MLPAIYQKKVVDLWLTKDRPLDIKDLFIMAQGLSGETGEVTEVITGLLSLQIKVARVSELLKKSQRDGVDNRDKLVRELGDAQYYLVRIASWFDITFDEILDTNIEKLEDRKARNTTRGSGDYR